MQSFIRKIFLGRTDEDVHRQFVKFSKGEFKNRALISAKKSAKNVSIGASAEFANELVKGVAEKLRNGESVKVSGAIVSTKNLKEEAEFSNLLAHCEVKQFQGVKRFLINTDIPKEKILALCEKFPKSFFALSFSAGETELKIKPKVPKSGKPGKGDEDPKADFCKLKTSDEDLISEFLFDVSDFKQVSIKHEFIINDIEIPKNEKDPAMMREKAVRKGKIVRHLKIDGQEIKKEKDFSA